MKRFFLPILMFCLVSLNTLADEVKSKVFSNLSEKITEYTLGIIPGEGHTEFSFDLRENNSPQYSILVVRELQELEDGNIFTQFSARNTEAQNQARTGDDNERIIFNLGLGARKLFFNEALMLGVNNFYDYDYWMGHSRTSLGFEARGSVLDFNANRYQKIDSSGSTEHVKDGWDYTFEMQIPYLHTSNVFFTGYEWETNEGAQDSRGEKFGLETMLTSTLALKLGVDDQRGVDNENYVHLTFIYPPKEADKFISNELWSSTESMKGELLSKVERTNNIVIEFTGSVTVSRTD